jgi:3-deoxy-D-manno-octulosonic-acid transferase
MWILYILYEISGILILPLAIVFYLKRISGKNSHWEERIGIYPKYIKNLSKKKTIWFHAVSIGEISTIIPIIKELQKRFSDINIILSCSSKSGREIANKQIPDIHVIFLPIDFYYIVQKSIRLIKPSLFILIEAEVWPNLLKILHNKNCHIIMLNGRISRNSFKIYKKFYIFFRKILSYIDIFVMRSQEDAQRIIKLGAEEKKVKITKSLKFDKAYFLSLSPIQHNFIKEKIIVFGSIHPGEEEPIVSICQDILNSFSDISIVIAPRYLDKTKIFSILNQRKTDYVRKSKWKNEYFKILILDVYGELTNFYRICQFAFVGGSLIPAGGQNPIEPFAFKKCVIFGKYNWDFKEEWNLLKQKNAGIQINDFNELLDKIFYLLRNPGISKKMGENGYNVIMENKGAIEESIKIIEFFLQENKEKDYQGQ